MTMQKSSGALIIEVLIAVVILITATLSIYTLIRTTQNGTLKTKYSSEMTILGQNAMEVAYDNLLTDWASFGPGFYYPSFQSPDKWILVPSTSPSGETDLETKYTRVVEIKEVCRDATTGDVTGTGPCSPLDPHSKIISVDVGWVNPNYGKPFHIELLATDQK